MAKFPVDTAVVVRDLVWNNPGGTVTKTRGALGDVVDAPTMGTYDPRKANQMKYSVAIKNGPTITVDESKMMSLQDFYFQCFMGEHLLLALREQLNDGTLSSVSLGPDEYTTLEIDEHDGVTRMTGEIKGFGKTKYPVSFHKVDLRHIEALYEQLYNDARAKWIKYKEGTARGTGGHLRPARWWCSARAVLGERVALVPCGNRGVPTRGRHRGQCLLRGHRARPDRDDGPFRGRRRLGVPVPALPV